MTIVVDTNVLVSLFGKKSPFRPLKLALQGGLIELAVSTPILLDYEEVICRLASPERWRDVERYLDLIATLYGTVRRVQPSYRFRAITGDPDDDAFADCATVGNADWILTFDAHFNALIGAGFRPQPISPTEFIDRFLTNGDQGI